jgi:uncharacterized protein
VNGTELVYASLSRRLLAIFLDNLVWFVFYFWFLGALVAVAFELSIAAGVAATVLVASLWLNYFAFCEWKWGQTIGKNATGIEVRSQEGNELSFLRQTSVRNLLRLVDFFVVGWVMIARDPRRQRLGDRAGRTIVVRTAPKTIPGQPAVRGAAEPTAAAPKPPPPPPPPATPKEGPRLPEVTWDAGDAGKGLVGGLILAAVVAPLLVLPFDPDLSSDGALLAAQALVGGSFIFVAVGVASRWSFKPLGEALGRLGVRNFQWSGIGIALLALLAYYVVVGLFVSLPFIPDPEQEDIGGELGIGDDNLLVAVAAVLLIVVVAAVAEELFFRGFVFAGLRKRFSLWPAALIVGGIFGLTHAPTGITAVVPLALLGIGFCWLYERTGSLWPCLFAHALNNALALSLTA